MDSKSDLRHHGILEQRWGKRNGPPYPLGGGDYSQAERKAIYKKRKQPNSIYNKKHFDEVLRADKTTLSTLSYDRDRTKTLICFTLPIMCWTSISTMPCLTERYHRQYTTKTETASEQGHF